MIAADGMEIFFVEHDDAIDLGAARSESASARWAHSGRATARSSAKIPYRQGRKGGFDPHARIPDMDAEGIDAAFLYPSLGLFLGAMKDPEFAAAALPRLQPLAGGLLQAVSGAAVRRGDVADAIGRARGARRCALRRRNWAFTRASSGPIRTTGASLHDPAYEPLWEEAQELDFAIGIHGGSRKRTGRRSRWIGSPRAARCAIAWRTRLR